MTGHQLYQAPRVVIGAMIFSGDMKNFRANRLSDPPDA